MTIYFCNLNDYCTPCTNKGDDERREGSEAMSVRRNHRDIMTRVLTNQRDRSYVYAVVSLLAAFLVEDRPNLTL